MLLLHCCPAVHSCSLGVSLQRGMNKEETHRLEGASNTATGQADSTAAVGSAAKSPRRLTWWRVAHVSLFAWIYTTVPFSPSVIAMLLHTATSNAAPHTFVSDEAGTAWQLCPVLSQLASQVSATHRLLVSATLVLFCRQFNRN